MIEILNLSKTFDSGVSALKDFSTRIGKGEFISLLGPSGCGKSTLLRLVSGLDHPTTGELRWNQSGTPRIGYVFQDAHLLPWSTVYENIALPLKLRHITADEIKRQTLKTLELVELLDFASAYPSQLSGGMKMRASLARALVNEPELLLLDEPFAALDEFTRQNLDESLRRLWVHKQMTVVFVTHSISEAAFLANRHLILTKRPARILSDLSTSLSSERTTDLKLSSEFLNEVRRLTEAFYG